MPWNCEEDGHLWTWQKEGIWKCVVQGCKAKYDEWEGGNGHT